MKEFVNKEYKNLGFKLMYRNLYSEVYEIVIVNKFLFKKTCLSQLCYAISRNRTFSVDERLVREKYYSEIMEKERILLYKNEFSFLEKINREVKIKDIKNGI